MNETGNLRGEGALRVDVEGQSGDVEAPSFPKLTNGALRATPSRQEDDAVTSTQELQGPIEPELAVSLPMEVSGVGVRDERHGISHRHHQPDALSGSNVLRNVPLCRATEGASYVDYLHTAFIK